MSIKYYKLQSYNPFWVYADGKYPRKHIEQILEESNIVNPWQEIKNVQWTDIDNVTATGSNESIPTYIKVDVNGDIYYYYLLNKVACLASKDNITQYRAVYELDEYMTAYWHKIEILREHNPNVYVNMGFQNRWTNRVIENTEYYEIDYIKQRYLSNTLSSRNNLMVRKLAYYTDANTIYALNNPNQAIPNTYTIHQYDNDNNTIVLGNATTPFSTILNTPNSRGRYLYYVAKSTAKMKSNNNELQNAYTSQKFIVIPFFAGQEEQIWHALNDFDKTITGNGFLVPQGSNEIGIYEFDAPYSIMWGWVESHKYGATMKYAHQPMGNNTYIDIPFFELDNNAPILLQILDYTRYRDGFHGKFVNMVQNIYLWTPETEPTMWNPSYYKETYNNGNSNLTIDSSFFTFKWNSNGTDTFGIQAYISFSDNLNIAYNFGDKTNTQLSTFDNTETLTGNISISNMYMGSNSANFFTTNASTIATSLANRQSEQAQAWTDAALNTAKTWVNTAPNGLAEVIFSTGNIIKRGITAGIDTARIMTDTALTQQRANRDFNSNINNITSSPSAILSNPNVKAVIPIKHGLFETYSIELHPEDKKVLFNSILHNGYVINHTMRFNDVAENRQLMNILNLNTTYFSDDLMRLLTENDTSIFNTKFWNRRFLAFLNNSSNIYETNYLINCTDYTASDYISNVERELPDIPTSKTHIANHIKNFIQDLYRCDLLLSTLEQDNPTAPSNIWEQIEITNATKDGFFIKAKSDSTDYFGEILVNKPIYNLSFIHEGETFYFFSPECFYKNPIVSDINGRDIDFSLLKQTTINFHPNPYWVGQVDYRFLLPSNYTGTLNINWALSMFKDDNYYVSYNTPHPDGLFITWNSVAHGAPVPPPPEWLATPTIAGSTATAFKNKFNNLLPSDVQYTERPIMDVYFWRDLR